MDGISYNLYTTIHYTFIGISECHFPPNGAPCPLFLHTFSEHRSTPSIAIKECRVKMGMKRKPKTTQVNNS